MTEPYTSNDYVAFMAYAGPPPPMAAKQAGVQRMSALESRLDYIMKCGEFCQQYFGVNPPSKYKNVNIRTEFYSAFMNWYAIRQLMEVYDK